MESRYRLKSDREFAQVYRRGQSVNAQAFYLKYLANHLGHARIGIVVSKKISKLATRRNLAKRLIKENLRSYLPKLGAYDIVISVKKVIVKEQTEVLAGELAGALKRGKLI